MAFHLYKRGSTSGVFLQNAEFFTPPGLLADIRSSLFNAIWSVSIIPTTTSNFEYTVDGGLTWFALSAKPMPAGVEAICNVTTEGIDTFNIRSPDPAGATVYRVIVSIAPQDIQRRAIEITGGVDAIPVDICPVTCDVPVAIQNQPIDVAVVSFLPDPLPVDICPVTCDLPVVNGTTTFDINIAGQVGADPLNIQGPQIGQPNGLTILNITDTAILANTDISGVDLSPTGTSAGDSVIFRVLWASNATGRLRFTLDGTNFVDFNNSVNLKGGASSIFDVVVDDGDSFNLQFSNATTITFLRVVQLI